jgi:hypothetical protein
MRRILPWLHRARDPNPSTKMKLGILATKLQSDGEHGVVLKDKVKFPLSRLFRKNLQDRLR